MSDNGDISTDLPEVDVPKGTLVELDVEGSFNGAFGSGSSSITVVCLDQIEPQVDETNLLRSPHQTDMEQSKIKLAVVFKVITNLDCISIADLDRIIRLTPYFLDANLRLFWVSDHVNRLLGNTKQLFLLRL